MSILILGGDRGGERSKDYGEIMRAIPAVRPNYRVSDIGDPSEPSPILEYRKARIRHASGDWVTVYLLVEIPEEEAVFLFQRELENEFYLRA